jgi:hypothetical protein
MMLPVSEWKSKGLRSGNGHVPATVSIIHLLAGMSIRMPNVVKVCLVTI